MSLKFAGAVLIFAAAIRLYLQTLRQNVSEIRYISDMASALEQMGAAVRFRRLPMPQILREQTQRVYCGSCFLLVEQYMKSGTALQESWRRAVRESPCASAKSALLELELDGDAQRLEENLRHCAAALRGLRQHKQVERRDRQKLTLALTASGCGLLVILLL